MKLRTKKIAILLANNFEDSEFIYPYYRMLEEGAEVVRAAMDPNATYTGKHGVPMGADVALESLRAEDFDAVIIPGGKAPEQLRESEAVIRFVKQMDGHDRVVASICHGGLVLIAASILRGRRATSVPAIKNEMAEAGTEWLDEEVVMDRNLITSRVPADLPAFCRTIISAMS